MGFAVREQRQIKVHSHGQGKTNDESGFCGGESGFHGRGKLHMDEESFMDVSFNSSGAGTLDGFRTETRTDLAKDAEVVVDECDRRSSG
uniref:Uncharacterized protein n=1 Tax=Cucumis melo TaxID=3656 RepID=A0A9I9CUM1_CUCME